MKKILLLGIILSITTLVFAENILWSDHIVKIDRANYEQNDFVIHIVKNDYQENLLNIEIKAPLLGMKESNYTYSGLKLLKGDQIILSTRPNFYKWQNHMKGIILIDKDHINDVQIDIFYHIPKEGVLHSEEFIYKIDIQSFLVADSKN